MTKFWNLGIVFSLFALCALSSCDDDNDSQAVVFGPGSVYEIVTKSGALSSLEASLDVATGDLPGTLNGSGPFTVFAPNNAAFESLAVSLGFAESEESSAAEKLLAVADADLFAQILTYHVVPGRLEAADLTDGATLTTVLGDELTVVVTVDEDTTTYQLLDATKLPETNPVSTVIQANVYGNNGIVHFIDKVLLPDAAIEALSVDLRPSLVEWVAATDDLSLLAGALKKADLLDAVAGLDTARVLAPNNAAFVALLDVLGDDYNDLDDFDNEAEIALLGDILLYHVLTPADSSIDLMAGPAGTLLKDNEVEVVVDGGGFAFGDVTATNAGTTADAIDAKNGYVNIIDKVLLPQAALDFIALLASDDLGTIVTDTADLSVLEEALIATDLVGAFTDATNEAFDSTATNFTYFRPATVFAPTNAAFTELLDLLGDDYTGIASFDTEPELELLKEILLYHVLTGKTLSTDFEAGPKTTLAERDIELINVLGTTDFVVADETNQPNANLVIPDVLSRNGVAHVVDKVLLPKSAVDFIKALNEEEE